MEAAQQVPKVHIMALTPEHQLVLKLLLAHHFKLQMRYVLDFLALNPSFINVERKWTSLTRAFNSYEDISGSFPTPETISRSKIKLCAYNTLAVNYIRAAIERFKEDEHVGMEDDEISFILQNYDSIKTLVDTSALHAYTLEEVKRASL